MIIFIPGLQYQSSKTTTNSENHSLQDHHTPKAQGHINTPSQEVNIQLKSLVS